MALLGAGVILDPSGTMIVNPVTILEKQVWGDRDGSPNTNAEYDRWVADGSDPVGTQDGALVYRPAGAGDAATPVRGYEHGRHR